MKLKKCERPYGKSIYLMKEVDDVMEVTAGGR